MCNISEGILEPNDIAHCRRLGKLETGKNRLILVVLKREDWAVDFHNFGRGRKYDDNVWVNPDLTKTEREAQFLARKKRKEKRDRPPVREAVPTAAADDQVEETDTDAGTDQVEETNTAAENPQARVRRASTRSTTNRLNHD